MKRITLLLAALLMLVRLPLPAAAVELELAGKSALLMDVNTGTVLYESNAHEKLAPASVTKIMTILLVMRAIEDGRVTLEDTVTCSEHAKSMGGSGIWLALRLPLWG